MYGNNMEGQIGDGTTEDRGVLQTVPVIAAVARIAMGEGVACALHRAPPSLAGETFPPPASRTCNLHLLESSVS